MHECILSCLHRLEYNYHIWEPKIRWSCRGQHMSTSVSFILLFYFTVLDCNNYEFNYDISKCLSGDSLQYVILTYWRDGKSWWCYEGLVEVCRKMHSRNMLQCPFHFCPVYYTTGEGKESADENIWLWRGGHVGARQCDFVGLISQIKVHEIDSGKSAISDQ